jgi:hypothetical protein
MSTSAGRVPPRNLDAEASVLGGILLRNEALHQIDQLVPDDLYDPRHREVFGAMKTLEARSRHIDPVTLDEQLAQGGKRGRGFLEREESPPVLRPPRSGYPGNPRPAEHRRHSTARVGNCVPPRAPLVVITVDGFAIRLLRRREPAFATPGRP